MMQQLLVLLAVLASGVALAAQSSINGQLGARVGVLPSAWLTFASGALVAFLLMLFFDAPHAANLFTVPKWQLTGALFGVVYMLAMVFAVPRVGTAAATVAVITGQLLMSLLIDNFGWLDNTVRTLDAARYGAMGLLVVALGLIYWSGRRGAL